MGDGPENLVFLPLHFVYHEPTPSLLDIGWNLGLLIISKSSVVLIALGAVLL